MEASGRKGGFSSRCLERRRALTLPRPSSMVPLGFLDLAANFLPGVFFLLGSAGLLGAEALGGNVSTLLSFSR